jgi:hypothetical protein
MDKIIKKKYDTFTKNLSIGVLDEKTTNGWKLENE